MNIWLAFLDRTNFTVIALTASFILFTRSAGVVYFAAGAVFCSLSVKLIKKGIRQPRPPNIPGRRAKVSYGMPSTHSASISYFVTYILLACIYLPVHPGFRIGTSGVWLRILAPFLILPWGAAIVSSRVWLGHHTWPQVIAGLSYGMPLACLWFSLWTSGINNFGKHVEEAFST